MVKILMKTTIAGPDMVAGAGQIITVEAAQAKSLVDGGYATVAPERPVVAPKVETATAENREKAVLPPVQKRKR